jgi:regulator of protease activity HflC (stomatin/prohibitin superfamily)
MTEQTAAERERRAAILRADGEKRSAVLRAEGLKKSMVLEAEGERQSKVLRAEGDRMSQILRAQGESQGLRILSLGARSLDKRAISVLSLDALKTMSDGQATKIVLPFEVSSLIRQSAKFLGATEDMVDEEAVSIPIDEALLGAAPDAAEVERLLRTIEEEVRTASPEEERRPDKDVSDLDDIIKN